MSNYPHKMMVTLFKTYFFRIDGMILNFFFFFGASIKIRFSVQILYLTYDGLGFFICFSLSTEIEHCFNQSPLNSMTRAPVRNTAC